MKPDKLSDEESAKLAFMRWVAASSDKAWLPRRSAAEAVWSFVAAWVKSDGFGVKDKQCDDTFRSD